MNQTTSRLLILRADLEKSAWNWHIIATSISRVLMIERQQRRRVLSRKGAREKLQKSRCGPVAAVGYGPHRTIYLAGVDAKWQGREGFPRAGGSGLGADRPAEAVRVGSLRAIAGLGVGQWRALQ